MSEDLHREMILDHFSRPRNPGALAGADLDRSGVNPLCGDQIHLTLKAPGGRIEDIRFEGKGCTLSQASASMMTEALKGKTLEEARALAQAFRRMVLEHGSPADLPGDLESLSAFSGVRNIPARAVCAFLAWDIFLKGAADVRH